MKISKTALSFDQIQQDLERRFAQSVPWSARRTSNMGTVLFDMITGTTETSLDAITFAAREGFLKKAVRASSILANVRSNGVRISRRTPAKTKAVITNPTIEEIYISAYDTFNVNGTSFYCRESFTLKGGESIEVTIYEGVPQTQQINLNTLNQDYPKILLNAPGFIVSDTDVKLFVNEGLGNVEWSVTNKSLFSLTMTDLVFYDTTLENGDVELSFGTGTNGARLPQNGVATVRYVLTAGANGNLGLEGAQVSWAKDSRVVGRVIETAAGGADIKPVSYYKNHGAVMKTASESLVSMPQWKAAILGYPGVADVVIQTQRDIAPNDPSWRNLIRLCILPERASSWGGANPNPSSAQWSSFIEWLQPKIGSHLAVQRYNPTRVPIDVTVYVYVYEETDLVVKRGAIEERIRNVFKHKNGFLGRSVAVDDISDAIKYSADQRDVDIDYLTVVQPTEDIKPDSNLKFIALRNLNVVVKYTQRNR